MFEFSDNKLIFEGRLPDLIFNSIYSPCLLNKVLSEIWRTLKGKILRTKFHHFFAFHNHKWHHNEIMFSRNAVNTLQNKVLNTCLLIFLGVLTSSFKKLSRKVCPIELELSNVHKNAENKQLGMQNSFARNWQLNSDFSVSGMPQL